MNHTNCTKYVRIGTVLYSFVRFPTVSYTISYVCFFSIWASNSKPLPLLLLVPDREGYKNLLPMYGTCYCRISMGIIHIANTPSHTLFFYVGLLDFRNYSITIPRIHASKAFRLPLFFMSCLWALPSTSPCLLVVLAATARPHSSSATA